MEKPKKIEFKGEVYWLDRNLIAPLSHFTEDGEFCADFGDISYAVVEGENVLRFHEIIGNMEDIKEVK